MYTKMRRSKQQLSEELIHKVLEENTNGILGVISNEGYPYTIPLNYIYLNGNLYFHSAKSGHKVDLIKENAKVSFTVVDEDTIVSEKFTSYYRSVIAFGKASIIESQEERNEVFHSFIEKYAKHESIEAKDKELHTRGPHALVIKVSIEHMTGKEAIEYSRERK